MPAGSTEYRYGKRSVIPIRSKAIVRILWLKIIKKNFSKVSNNSLPNGLLCLKGGNVEGEMHPYRKIAEAIEITNWFSDDWFKDKFVIYVPAT